MEAITKYNRETWNTIATIGDIAYIAIEGPHYITVGYRTLTEYGQQYFDAQVAEVKTDLGEGAYKVIGYSVAWFNVPTEMAKLCNYAFNIATITQGNLADLYECIKLTRMSKLTEDMVDEERGSVYYTDGMNSGLIYGEVSYQSVAMHTLTMLEVLETRLATIRTLWYKWLKEAEFVSLKTGNVFKFPNGLTVKMDDATDIEDGISSDGYRLFAETMEPGGNIERHYTEEEFLVWLNRFF